MTQHSSSLVEKPVLDNPNTQTESSAGTIHSIRKIIKNNSVEYFCNEHNTHYARLSWVLEDHPKFDTSKFTVHDLRKEGIYA